MLVRFFFFFSSRRRHTRSLCDWSSDVCSSDLSYSSVSWWTEPTGSRTVVCGGPRPTHSTPCVSIQRSEEHTSELQSHSDLVCRLLLEKKKKINIKNITKEKRSKETHTILHRPQ